MRGLLGVGLGRIKGRGQEWARRAFGLQCRSDFCERRGGRNEDW